MPESMKRQDSVRLPWRDPSTGSMRDLWILPSQNAVVLHSFPSALLCACTASHHLQLNHTPV